MSMGNFLCLLAVGVHAMAATTPRIGIDHPTTVPTNFEPPDDEDGDEADS